MNFRDFVVGRHAPLQQSSGHVARDRVYQRLDISRISSDRGRKGREFPAPRNRISHLLDRHAALLLGDLQFTDQSIDGSREPVGDNAFRLCSDRLGDASLHCLPEVRQPGIQNKPPPRLNLTLVLGASFRDHWLIRGRKLRDVRIASTDLRWHARGTIGTSLHERDVICIAHEDDGITREPLIIERLVEMAEHGRL